jgi:NitT/TauT family transport system substrate-binding protein
MKKSKSKKILSGLFFCILLASSFFTYQYYFKIPTIRLAVNEWPGFAPAVYAQVLGLYKKYDIPIEIVYSPGTIQSNSWFLNKQIDGITGVLADIVLLKANGSNAQALLFVDSSKEADTLVARPDIKDVTELKGKTIGIDSLNSFSHLFVLKILERNGLSERDVFFKVVPFDQVTEALVKNEVQAAHTWDPELRNALSAGFKRIAVAGDIPGVILDCIVFERRLLQQYPQVFKKFILAFYEAQDLMLQNPYYAANQMKYFFRNDPKVFASSFKELHFIDIMENKRRMDPNAPDSFLAEALKLNEFYLKRGQTYESDLHEDILAKDFQL